jgi:hypothetical protein
MSDQITENEVEVEVDETEPIYYKPRSLNLVATISGIMSWVVLAGFIAVIVGQYFYMQEASQGAPLATLLASAPAKAFIYTNIVIPLLNGLSLFLVLQGVSIGLNVLLEIDFSNRESKS